MAAYSRSLAGVGGRLDGVSEGEDCGEFPWDGWGGVGILSAGLRGEAWGVLGL